MTSKVEPFPPGHVETYNLDVTGRAILAEKTRFHKIGEPPAYPTFPIQVGRHIIVLCENVLMHNYRTLGNIIFKAYAGGGYFLWAYKFKVDLRGYVQRKF